MFGSKVKTTYLIEGMSCGHCSSKVKEALEQLDQVKQASVSEVNHKAIVRSDESLDENLIKRTIEDLGFIYKGIEE